jgi:TolB-like protein
MPTRSATRGDAARAADPQSARKLNTRTARTIQLFPYTKARKNPTQQVITGELASDLIESLLRGPQLFSDQLARTALLQLATGFLGVTPGAGEGVEVALAR